MRLMRLLSAKLNLTLFVMAVVDKYKFNKFSTYLYTILNTDG